MRVCFYIWYMMRNAVLGFAEQFGFEPKMEQGPVPMCQQVIVAGLGGSHLAADLLASLAPHKRIRVWSDYGLPAVEPVEIGQTLFIASSYSGNTEETIDAYHEARKAGFACAIMAVGGKLIELAKQDGVPYVQLPNTGIQPRSALGFGMRALMTLLLVDETLVQEARGLQQCLQPAGLEKKGQELADVLRAHVPIVYASTRNISIAYNWKIKLNETGKVPAFYNIVPELNHNEMTGFDIADSTKSLSQNFAFVFLKDHEDHPRNQRRMEVMAKLYRDRGLPVHEVVFEGQGRMERVFTSLLLADWTAIALAAHYGLESEQVPMVEEFKKSL
jgi:glucose/mannose-6-phosphate isomerase